MPANYGTIVIPLPVQLLVPDSWSAEYQNGVLIYQERFDPEINLPVESTKEALANLGLHAEFTDDNTTRVEFTGGMYPGYITLIGDLLGQLEVMGDLPEHTTIEVLQHILMRKQEKDRRDRAPGPRASVGGLRVANSGNVS